MKQIYIKRGRKVNYIIPESEKMTFKGQYFSLPDETSKNKFIKEIMDVCYVSKATVRSWIAQAYKPDNLRRTLIAEKLGSKPEILFPDEV